MTLRSKNFFIFFLAVLLLVPVTLIGAQEKAPEKGKEDPYAKPYPMGFVTITMTEIGAGVGYEWGNGVLTYKGKEYTFKVKGLQVGTVGVKRATIKGDVYNLFDVGQFPGPYAAGQAGAAVIKGKEGLILQNQQGVRLHLNADQKGLNLSIGPEGFTIAMEKAL
jgi:hypothetical protein